MDLTADIVYGFSESVLKKNYDNPQPTPRLHKEMWEICCSDEPKVAIAAPRGHAKSTAVTHAYTLATLLFRQRSYALVISDTETQAIQFLNDIKNELHENEELKVLFNITRFIKESESDIIVEMGADKHQFRVTAKGAEQKIRGLKWRGRRPDLIICDDLENDEIVLNEERRKKFRDWFYGAVIPALSDSGIIRVVGTILHLDALLERFMPQLDSDLTVDGPLMSYSRDFRKAWFSVRYRAHSGVENFDHILWEDKFSEERLSSIRKDYVDQGFPEGYAQEYLNYPIDDTIAYFRKGDFIPLDETSRNERLEYYIGADLAISEKDRSAYTVFVVAGVDTRGVMKIVDVVRFRGDSLEIIDQMFSLHKRYTPEMFIVEKENIARSIGPFIYKRMEETGVYINLATDAVPSVDKMKRARSIQARLRAGQVQFDTEAEWYPTFLMEMLQFPRGRYMDQVDALSWIGLYLDKQTYVKSSEEIEEEEWEEEKQDTYDDVDSYDSMDWITGYG